MNNNLLSRLEEKTHVDKNTILDLAKKLQSGDYKNENTLREIIHEISDITGKDVSVEKENKIIDMIVNDQVPNNLEKYI